MLISLAAASVWTFVGTAAALGAYAMVRKRYYFQFVSFSFVSGLSFLYCYLC